MAATFSNNCEWLVRTDDLMPTHGPMTYSLWRFVSGQWQLFQAAFECIDGIPHAASFWINGVAVPWDEFEIQLHSRE